MLQKNRAALPGRAVESGSRTLAKNTFRLMASLKLQYLHVHFPLGNCYPAENFQHREAYAALN